MLDTPQWGNLVLGVIQVHEREIQLQVSILLFIYFQKGRAGYTILFGVPSYHLYSIPLSPGLCHVKNTQCPMSYVCYFTIVDNTYSFLHKPMQYTYYYMSVFILAPRISLMEPYWLHQAYTRTNMKTLM